MCQTKHIQKILQRFGMQGSKPRKNPSEMNPKDFENDTLLDEHDAKIYRHVVGSLIYIMTGTRPDLSYIVTRLSQDMSQPYSVHMIMAKHVLRYLSGTADRKLVYRKSDESLTIIGYCDADLGKF